jgi:BirA family biotin operon repressor/biotin-[acetyl-CoA-carboxylase] ligase
MSGWPAGVDRLIFDSIDSTNAEAARRVAAGLTAPLWIFAAEQTAGVGRRGRVWASPKGNFAATVALPLNEPVQFAALRSFVAANALYDACQDTLGAAVGLSLKWPNDVLYKDRKMAGILLETLGHGPSHMCIGFGVNLNSDPSGESIEQGALPPIRLGDHLNKHIDPLDFLSLLATHFDAWNRSFEAAGFAPTRSVWMERAARLGQVITARTGQRSVTGIFETVDENGVLVLQAPDQRHLITAADIFFDETGI